jgi:hypothetical protein
MKNKVVRAPDHNSVKMLLRATSFAVRQRTPKGPHKKTHLLINYI